MPQNTVPRAPRLTDAMSTVSSALWRRLDTPGHDSCVLTQTIGRRQFEGTAVFRHDLGPASLRYWLLCSDDWRTLRGGVQGWIGATHFDVRVERSDEGIWLLGDKPVPGLDDCLHLDFGFTPATNFPEIQHTAVSNGAAADIPAAWLDLPDGALVRLPQRYERRSATTYWYEAPTADYAALFELGESGFLRRYPNLWEMEAEWQNGQ
jgi:uncharacterized protein